MRFARMWKESLARRLGTPLLLALGVWLCLLPLLALIVLPLFGWKAALYTGGALLITDLAACWFLCVFKVNKTPGPGQTDRGTPTRPGI